MKITVRKISSSEIQVTVSADIRISGDLAQLLAPDLARDSSMPAPTTAALAGRSC